jgi:WD40 repeat protein
LRCRPTASWSRPGGWTGWDWDGKGSIYLFDVASGDLVRRLGGLDETVGALVWSPDGQHLVVGLQGRGGLRVLRADNRHGHRERYAVSSTSSRTSTSARRAASFTTALDGRVRLYAPDFRLIGRRRFPAARSRSR